MIPSITKVSAQIFCNTAHQSNVTVVSSLSGSIAWMKITSRPSLSHLWFSTYDLSYIYTSILALTTLDELLILLKHDVVISLWVVLRRWFMLRTSLELGRFWNQFVLWREYVALSNLLGEWWHLIKYSLRCVLRSSTTLTLIWGRVLTVPQLCSKSITILPELFSWLTLLFSTLIISILL